LLAQGKRELQVRRRDRFRRILVPFFMAFQVSKISRVRKYPAEVGVALRTAFAAGAGALVSGGLWGKGSASAFSRQQQQGAGDGLEIPRGKVGFGAYVVPSWFRELCLGGSDGFDNLPCPDGTQNFLEGFLSSQTDYLLFKRATLERQGARDALLPASNRSSTLRVQQGLTKGIQKDGNKYFMTMDENKVSDMIPVNYFEIKILLSTIVTQISGPLTLD
jgi:hypothetical protein